MRQGVKFGLRNQTGPRSSHCTARLFLCHRNAARSQAPCVVCYRPQLWHWSPCTASRRFRARWRQGRVDLLSTSAWQAQQQNLVVLLKLSRDPMIELNGFVFFLQEQTHLFLQKDQEINMSTEKPSSAGRSCNWLHRLSTYGQGTSGVSTKKGTF